MLDNYTTPEQQVQEGLQWVLDTITKVLNTHMVMGQAEKIATALWIAHTPFYQAFKLTPRLFVTSIGPASGKSTLLKLVASMVPGGIYATNVTVSSLTRLKDKAERQGNGVLTVMMDQLDTSFEEGAGRSLINQLIMGADQEAKSIMTEKIGEGRNEPTVFDVFYPMGIGKIGRIPSDALISRCILIQMHPATDADSTRLYKQPDTSNVAAAIRSKLTPVPSVKTLEYLSRSRPDIPDGLSNRVRDKWVPLLAMADLAGGAWPEWARKAAVTLEVGGEESEPAAVKLLRRVVGIAAGWKHPIIFSEELDGILGRQPKKERERELSPKTRGKMLAQVGIKTSTLRRDGRQAKGYLVQDIMIAAEKYIRPEGEAN